MSMPAGTVPNPRLALERPDPENRNALGYEWLLDAVLCLLVESGATALAEGFKPDHVAKRAGKSRASYYRTEGFPAGDVLNSESRLAVLEAAIDRALQQSAVDVNRRHETLDRDIEEGRVPDSPAASIRLAACADFAAVRHAIISTRLYAAALSPSSVQVEASLHRHYEAVTGALVDAYGKVLEHWGYRPRAPLDLEQFVVTVLALADGLILRYCADDCVDADLYSKLLAEVATSLLEPVPSAPTPSCSRPEPGDHHTSGGWFDDLEKAVREAPNEPLRSLHMVLEVLAARGVADNADTRAFLADVTSQQGPSSPFVMAVGLVERLLNDAALQGVFRSQTARGGSLRRARNALLAEAFVSPCSPWQELTAVGMRLTRRHTRSGARPTPGIFWWNHTSSVARCYGRALSVRRRWRAASRRMRGTPLGCPATVRCACGVRSRC